MARHNLLSHGQVFQLPERNRKYILSKMNKLTDSDLYKHDSKGNKRFLSLQSTSGQAARERERPCPLMLNSAQHTKMHNLSNKLLQRMWRLEQNWIFTWLLCTFLSNRTMTPFHSINITTGNLFLNNLVSTSSYTTEIKVMNKSLHTSYYCHQYVWTATTSAEPRKSKMCLIIAV